MAGPRKEIRKRRLEVLQVKLTMEELDWLRGQAESERESVSEYVRACVFGSEERKEG